MDKLSKAKKPNWWQEKQGEKIVGVLFVIFAFGFFVKEQYWPALTSIILLISLLKLDTLSRLALSPKSGLETEYKNKEEKIKLDIKENKDDLSQENIKFYKNLENLIIKRLHKEIGGDLKTGVTFVYGIPDKPQFKFVPDGVIRKKDGIIFLEIKHIIDPKLTENIIKKALQNLNLMLESFKPSAGDINLKAKLIIASRVELDTTKIPLPEDIEIEVVKV